MIPPSLQGTILLVQRNHSLCDFLSLLTNTQQKRQPLRLAFLRLSCKKIFFCARRGFSVSGKIFPACRGAFCVCFSGGYFGLPDQVIFSSGSRKNVWLCLPRRIFVSLSESFFRLIAGMDFPFQGAAEPVHADRLGTILDGLDRQDVTRHGRRPGWLPHRRRRFPERSRCVRRPDRGGRRSYASRTPAGLLPDG